MASLILNGDTLRVNLVSKRVEVMQRIYDKNGERQVTSQVPLYAIERVVVVGRPTVTLPVLTRFLDEGIPCFFVTRYGRWRGSMLPDKNRNAGRRIRQYERGTEGEFAVGVAQRLIYAKIRNSRRVLQRLAANRECSSAPEQVSVTDDLKELAVMARSATTVDMIRGYEGMAAALYFERLGDFFPDSLPFTNRNRRPPRDPANALLSFAYTILLGEVEGAVRSRGLDAGIGCLHCDTINTPSLALDLMEPLRPALADLLVLNIVNHNMVKAEADFEVNAEDGGTYLNETGRKVFFLMYEQAMTRRFAIAKGEPHTDLRRVIEEQINIYLRMLEQDTYDDFFLLP
ncbi:MAG: CRISPR-associated endonuclease Cas1 [Lentisphaerae bacterium]|jgi:CRISPR-associated protein Cas1|nr:CRISPR-associated endonuclease Cas1 [Lentisphaerota bacterium]